jgi:hypothetical protein
LPSLSWFSLLSLSVCRILWRIFCSDGLMVIYCVSFCLSWNIFIAPSILIVFLDRILRLKLFSFSAQKTSLHTLLAFKISLEKSVILMGLPLYVICFFYLTACSILSLLPVFVVLMIICQRVVLFWSSLFGVLEAFCT